MPSLRSSRSAEKTELAEAIRPTLRAWSAVGLIALGGCAVLRGAPAPATDVAQENAAFAVYLTGDVLQRAVSTNAADRNGMTPLQWRDAVIAARLQIMDQNFLAFKAQLRAQITGLNLGTDLAALGLTAAAAVTSGGTAKALAAASTGVIGVGTAFNKDALFQQTLPAIFSQMDADRSAVRIRTAQAQGDISKYPLLLALTDLAAYERAGTIESATASLTQSASDQAFKNQVELKGIMLGTPTVDARMAALTTYIQGLVKQNDIDTLTKIAKALGQSVPPKSDAVHIRAIILRYTDSFVSTKTSEQEMVHALDELAQILKPFVTF
jgi:hypothetical protein